MVHVLHVLWAYTVHVMMKTEVFVEVVVAMVFVVLHPLASV